MNDNLPDQLIVGTMCHCDDLHAESDDYDEPYDPDEDCTDHWELWVEARNMDTEGHVGTGSHLNATQMRAVASFVTSREQVGWVDEHGQFFSLNLRNGAVDTDRPVYAVDR